MRVGLSPAPGLVCAAPLHILNSDFDISLPFCLPWVSKDWLMRETKAKHADISNVSHNAMEFQLCFWLPQIFQFGLKEANKITKTEWELNCGTPCINIYVSLKMV